MKLYFDYISPSAYLAWTQLHALAARHGRELEPVPVLFAALLDAHRTRGPAEVSTRCPTSTPSCAASSRSTRPSSRRGTRCRSAPREDVNARASGSAA